MVNACLGRAVSVSCPYLAPIVIHALGNRVGNQRSRTRSLDLIPVVRYLRVSAPTRVVDGFQLCRRAIAHIASNHAALVLRRHVIIAHPLHVEATVGGRVCAGDEGLDVLQVPARGSREDVEAEERCADDGQRAEAGVREGRRDGARLVTLYAVWERAAGKCQPRGREGERAGARAGAATTHLKM